MNSNFDSETPGDGPGAASFARLVREARAGDPRAVDRLVERYRDYLLLVANQELDAQLVAKFGPSDLVQQSLITVHQRLAQFRGSTEAEFRRWVRSILLNGLKDARRRFLQAERRDVARERPFNTAPVEIPLIDPLRTPCTQAAAGEQALLLQRALAELSPSHRQVIELRHWHDQTFREIGAQMELSEMAARKLWYRAVTKLQQIIVERYPSLGSTILPANAAGDADRQQGT